MKNSIKKNLRFSFLSLLAVFLFFSVVSCNSIKQVPVYEGMTISTNGNVATRKLNKHNEEDKENGEGHKKHDELEEDISDVVEIDIITDDSVKYYVQPNETFIVEIHISNPNDFEIQSFTLNGEKYANYMFEDGSDMELLLLEVTAPSEPGYYEYTVDAIKYIDGEEIKNVDMSKAEKTVKTGIAYTTLPTAEVFSSVIGTTSIELDINVNDTEGVIEDKLTIELSDGEQIVASKPLVVGTNNVKFDNLLMDKTYQYGIVSIYDIIDGNGPQINWLLKDIFSTDGAFELDNFVVNQESISFGLITNDENATLTSIDLYDEDSGELIINGTNETKEFTNLLTNHSYYIQVNYSYINGEDTIEDCVIYENFVTKKKVAPTFEFEELTSDKTSISYKVSCEDVDGVTSKVNVLLLKDGEQVSDNGNVLEGIFSNLLSNTLYTIKVVYEYDLHDGNGVISDIIENQYTTTVDSVGIEEIIVLNEGTVKVGEEMNLRIYFDNPSNIELTGIYVNGQLVEVVGGNRVSNAIIKFVPETDGGVYNFFVDQVNYLTHDIEITQLVDSDISVSYPIYGGLKEITFKPISSIYSINIYPGIIMEFDNSETNYTIYSINDGSLSFEKISEGKYLVYSGNIHGCSINSIEYGCEGYGTTTQIFDEHFEVTRVEQNIVYIYDNEDFLNMSGENYFILMNDLDFSKASGIDQIMLNGVLDGNGHTITGLSIVKELHNSIFPSIFSYSGIVINTNFEEIYISCKDDSFAAYHDSNIFGEVRAYNCKVEGDVNIEFVDGAFSVRPMDTSNELSIRYNVNGEKINVNQTAVKIEGNNFIHLDGCHYFDIGTDQYVLFAVDDIPEITIDGRCVFMLKNCAKNNSRLVKVVIEEGVKTIGEYAFSNSNLKEVILPDSLERIEAYAFNSCESLKRIELPKNLIFIGKNAFAKCGSLDCIIIPESVEVIENHAISASQIYCEHDSKPEGWNENWTNAWIDSICWKNQIILGGPKALVFEDNYVVYDGEVHGLEVLGLPYFMEVEYENNYQTEPGEYVVTAKLKSNNPNFPVPTETMTAKLAIVSEEEFYDESFDIVYNVINKSEVSIYIDSILESEENVSLRKYLMIDQKLYTIIEIDSLSGEENKILKSIIIPDGVIYIGQRAFSKCSSLESVTIPSSVVSIGGHAFEDCVSLETIEIPDSVTSIGQYSFLGCISLKEVTLPIELKTIEEGMFAGCTLLESIEIPDSVTSIKAYAFSICRSLKDITLPKELNSIEESAFEECSSLKNINIPNSVVTLGERAFYFSGIENITLSENITTIGEWTFFGTPLKSVIIPNSVTSIGENAFECCEQLENIVLSENLTKIDSCALSNLLSLKNIVIPKSVTTICDNAFMSNVLDNVYYNGTLEDWLTIIFEIQSGSSNPLCCGAKLYLLDENGTVEYLGKKYSLVENIVISNISEIKPYAFYGCSSIKTVVIKEDVINVGVAAFGYNDLLTIYCEAESKPDGFDYDWNPIFHPVYWGGQWEYVDGIPTPISN